MIGTSSQEEDPFSPPAPDQERAARVDASLSRLTERHASSDEARRRQDLSGLVAAHEAVRLVSLIGGGAVPHAEGEAAVDRADLVAAMTLLPVVRAEVDELEASVLFLARSEGMTWAQIAFAMGLRSAQAAQQRGERLGGRGDADQFSAHRPGDDVSVQTAAERAGKRTQQ